MSAAPHGLVVRPCGAFSAFWTDYSSGMTSYFPQQAPLSVYQKPKNGMGTSALVIGVAACTAAVCSPIGAGGSGAAILAGLIGTVFGSIGISRANEGVATNRASAIAGLVTSGGGPVIALIGFMNAA
jgi:uncharacterized protein YpuA (DUF1002 family)